MDSDNRPVVQPPGRSALEHSRAVTQALREAARRARFSKRSRRNAASESPSARRNSVLMRGALIASFIGFVLLPSLAAATYYLFFASNQYISEAQFTVSGASVPKPDGIASMTGIPAMSIIQDTQIVTNYIHSRASAELLQSTVNLRALYSKPDIDWMSRFDPAEPVEKFVEYWKNMSTVAIRMPGGIVSLHVRAFSPQDAADITRGVIAASERLINDMDERMHQDAVVNTENQVAKATARLAFTRATLEKARNDSGILDAAKAGEATMALIGGARSTLLRMQQDYQTQLQSLSPQAPQMLILKSRIDVAIRQVSELEAQITRKPESTGGDVPISGVMSKLSELDLDNKVAERLYAGALASLEGARLTAQNKMMYLTTFVQPVLPQDSEYPHRIRSPFLIFTGCLGAWAILASIAVTVRNRMSG